ncbi:TPA: virB8 family protein [Pseudomonas aeruginosa]|uniref:virB8 family protein n=1 Tax=Pseudomonas aeruginosa TaxID=287 RepID=UPI000E32DC4F|nr:virB8 family protein [Pseudomonas aeruginosa]SYY08074.1 Type IV secretion system protein virB8 [Acinetobacter baumannii]MDP2556120.1 virB8 family protein [Pseudomonas aeruginosa]QPN17987.1 virB8 family protein [Pseudomonas aeruginosa]HBN8448266.1 virB8 family protein [Pseudomonas aeruginosa]HCF9833317.1 virB8 family protein [Pseudomonas aeruginosa]
MFGRKKPADDAAVQAQPTTIFDGAMDWEASRIQSIEKSERRAWKVAGAFGGGFVLSVLAITFMMPLKESVPYVIRVDNTTGVPDIVTALDTKGVGYDEVMDKYWMAQYVRARETYDWYTLQKDYNTVGLLSSANVGATYAALFEGKDALDKKYGSSVRATVEIVSVVPTGRGTGAVRFIKTTKRVDDPDGAGTVTKWVATVAYEYRNPSLIKESQRLVNPFGFQVLSYRVDPEMVGGAQ